MFKSLLNCFIVLKGNHTLNQWNYNFISAFEYKGIAAYRILIIIIILHNSLLAILLSTLLLFEVPILLK